jgi:pimeloyl-ACP methyl ester carboxylesterase
MDDLNEVREILGYGQINLVGASYGTRAALVYLRQHPSTVRSAILEGVAPIEFINPLYHAQEAQRALDLIFAEVESDQEYRDRFPRLRERFAELLNQFEQGPMSVEFAGETLELSRDMFTAGLRYQLYYLDSSRQVPFQLDQATRGNFGPFLASVLARNESLQDVIAMGMLLCVTAAEDLDRIDPAVIASVTSGTFLGDSRIRQQLAAAENWPRSSLPTDFGNPIAADVPTLILSGTLDPVTSPRFGDLIQQRFPNSLHVVAPGAHGLEGDCINAIKEQFLEQGSVVGLDCDCVQQMTLPRFRLQ